MSGKNLSVFGSTPAPQRDDMLFCPDEDWESNACIASTVADWVYFTGFRRAAEHLAEHVCSSGKDQDFLVYPIIYLYRHHIELVLKSIFESSSILLDHTPTEDELKALGRHSLLELWTAIRPLLNSVCDRAGNPPFPETELEGIDSYIRQIHEHDPDGQRFRYATIKTRGAGQLGVKIPSLRSGLKLVNVRTFSMAMDKLISHFEGIESWFSDLEDAYAEFKRSHAG